MKPQRLETISFYVLLATIILVPLAFLPSPYIALDFVKTMVIAFGTLVSAILLGISFYREKRISLPPRSITWLSLLITLSLVISAFTSTNAARAFFGQGFETTTVSFVLLMFVVMYLAFELVIRKVERAGLIYAALGGTYMILFLFHALRLLIGPSFSSLSILSTLSSTFFGTWSSFGVFSLFVALISYTAITYLPITGKMKIAYWVLAVVGAITGIIIYPFWALFVFTVVLLGIALHVLMLKRRAQGGTIVKNIPWFQTITFVLFLIITLWGAGVSSSIATSIRAGYTELALPWQLTLDVAAGAIKAKPLFGVGPNHFNEAFLAFKPLVINTTDLWGIEFNNGVGTLPTYLVNQGLFGGLLWLLFLILLGYLGWKTLRHQHDSPSVRFTLLSSYLGTAFTWLVLIAYAPSHAMIFITFLTTGLWLGAATHYGVFKSYSFSGLPDMRTPRFIPITVGALTILAVVWGLVYVKKSVALAYFTSGVKHLTADGDIGAAEASFATASKIDSSDVYWQARSEAGLAKIRQLAASLNNNTASSTAIAGEIAATLDQSLKYAQQAISVNPVNYYNYISAARVSEMAMNFKIANAYESAIKSYSDAIRLNPYNPSLYLNIARVAALQGKYDESLQAIGSALQVKGNYTDAAFMASQIAAAQGKISDAITAAQVATQLSPNAPLVFFQLGILDYTNKDYSGAAQALETAVKLQNDYANARYFLGLSYARLGRTTDALAQFTELAKTNPDNQEVLFILNNLKAGKSPFTDAQPPITPNPEKRSTPPLKEKDPSAKDVTTKSSTKSVETIDTDSSETDSEGE